MRKILSLSIAVGMIPLPVEAQVAGSQPDWIEQAQLVAKRDGISVGEAVRRARLQDKVNRANEKALADPDFGGAWIEQNARGFRATFAFKNGKKPTVGDQELQDTTSYANAGRSLAELRQARNEIMRELRANGLTAAFSENVKSQRLELWPDEPEKFRALVSAGTLKFPDFVDVQATAATPVLEYDVYGSGSITESDGTNCTGGLVVTDGTNRGIATAGHCSTATVKATTHRDQPIGSLMRSSQRLDGNGLDVSWYRNASYTYLNRARITSTSYYSITSVGSQVPVAGTTVCVLPRTNAQVCTSVVTNYTYTTTSGAPDGPYIVTQDYVTEPKDSGAPWLYGGVAYGIHLGAVPYLNVTRSMYSPAASLPRIGIQVLTQP